MSTSDVDQLENEIERLRALSTSHMEGLLEAERIARGQAEAGHAEANLLFRLSTAANHAGAIEEVYEPALDVVIQALHVDRASVLLFDADGVMRFRAWRGLSDAYVRAVEGHSPWSREAVDPEPVLVADVHTAEAWQPYREVFDREGIRALGFIPLVHHHRLLGKFMLYGNAPRTFSAHEVELAQTIAIQVGHAVARAQLLEAERVARADAERNADRLHRLQNVTARLSEAATPAEVADVIVREGVAATGAANGGLWLLNLDTRIAELVHAVGYTDEGRAGFATIDVGGPLAMPVVDVFRHDQPIWVASRDELTARYAQLSNLVSHPPEYRIACLPVRARGRCIAAFALTFDAAGPFDEAEQDFLLSLARQGSLALERSRLLEAERGARVEAEAAQRRLAFKAEASALLAASLDYETSLATVATLALPRFADWCVVELGDSANELVTIARDGDPDPELVALARETGSPSAICAPITIHGRTIGRFLFGRTDPRRPYDAADAETAALLGQRAAFAIDNARLQQNLAREVKTRDDLLAIVSHDLRSPLGVISMKATLIERMLPNEPGWMTVRKNVSGIQSATTRMEALIDDLLDLSSIESGQLKVQPEPQDLGSLLAGAVDDLQALAAVKTLRLDVKTPIEPVRVRCDPRRIRQVLSNLIGNAIKHTANDGSIVVYAERDAERATVLVRDSGRGIDARDLPRIFERYYQAPTSHRAGVGLGLYIAKAIVEAHGGRIWAESTPGAGSRFYFTLPLDGDGLTPA
jgi:signal transduction histidine kinase